MKPKANLFACCCIAGVLLIGLIGCGEDAVEEDPVEFVQAIPASGSEIQPDATIIASFDGTPTSVQVTGVKFSVSGANVTITGPFTAGALNLVITWSDGAASLTYNVKASAGATAETEDPPAPPPEGMVWIPAGEFDMGSDDAEADNDEQPVRRVYVDAFYMDETEVTNLQFKEFVLENPRWQKNELKNNRLVAGNYLEKWNGNNYPAGRSNHPVTHVGWFAMMAYAEWSGKRLPTEAEWEYAARGGLERKKYPNGNTITAREAHFGIELNRANSGKVLTIPVGKYPANGYGLYDMAGNVWELCLDQYDAEFYFTFPRNGVARNPVSGANSIQWILDNWRSFFGHRIGRGGGWHSEAPRVAQRSPTSEINGGRANGFRCVKDVTP